MGNYAILGNQKFLLLLGIIGVCGLLTLYKKPKCVFQITQSLLNLLSIFFFLEGVAGNGDDLFPDT